MPRSRGGRRRPCWPRAAPASRCAQDVRDLGVLLGDADVHVDHEEDDVGVGDRPFGLAAHLAGERFGAVARRRRQPTAGVDDDEGAPVPVGLEHLAVAGDARASPRRSRRGDRRSGSRASTCRRWDGRRRRRRAGSRTRSRRSSGPGPPSDERRAVGGDDLDRDAGGRPAWCRRGSGRWRARRRGGGSGRRAAGPRGRRRRRRR